MLNRIIFTLGIRMVMGLAILGFAGIASLVSHGDKRAGSSSNPWSKNYSDSGSNQHKQATSSRSSQQAWPRTETVYRDKDGVEHGVEDLKAYDPNEIVIHDASGRVVTR